MYVAGARRSVEDEVVEFSPLSFAYELLECVASHAATPESRLVRVDEESYGEEFDSIFLYWHDEVTSVHRLSVRAFVFDVKHLWHGRAEDVSIEQSHSVAKFGKSHRKVGSDSRLAHTSLARADSYDVFHSRQQFVWLRRQRRLGHSIDGDLYIWVHKSLDGSFRSLDNRLHEGVCRLLEYKRERDLHTVNAEVIFEHLVVHQAFSVAWVAYCRKCVVYEFGVNSHC